MPNDNNNNNIITCYYAIGLNNTFSKFSVQQTLPSDVQVEAESCRKDIILKLNSDLLRKYSSAMIIRRFDCLSFKIYICDLKIHIKKRKRRPSRPT